jgi:hypothetical protein
MDLDEEFVPVPGFERYAISKSGTVKNVMTGLIRKQYNCVNPKDGYKSVRVSLVKDDGTETNCAVSRLLAKAFIPNPEGKLTVDHIDKNSLNNDLSNLQWATTREQNLNRNMPLSSSGHRHIYKSRNGYRVQIPRLKINKTFETIEEAIAARAILMPEEESSPT